MSVALNVKRTPKPRNKPSGDGAAKYRRVKLNSVISDVGVEGKLCEGALFKTKIKSSEDPDRKFFISFCHNVIMQANIFCLKNSFTDLSRRRFYIKLFSKY